MEWAFDRIKEAFLKAAKDEATKKLSTVQEIILSSTDHLRRIIAPAGKQGRKGYELVVRDLWRKIRLEAIEQALDGANRRKC